MNVFFVDRCPRRAAQALGDKHVGKMLLESAQLMFTAARAHGYRRGYKPTHVRHPMTLWVGRNRACFHWVLRHAEALAEEYVYRYGKAHKSAEVLPELKTVMDSVIPPGAWTDPPACMPDAYKTAGNAVRSYRNFYRKGKPASLHVYTRRKPPRWLASAMCKPAKTP